MSYIVLKHIHVTAVALSATGFFLRGLLMLRGSSLLQARWIRIAPHILDTVLLGSAIAMAVMSAQYPFVQPWLTAKFFGLIAYILCGTMALKRAKTLAARRVWYFAALAVVGWVVSVALTRNPWGYLGVLG